MKSFGRHMWTWLAAAAGILLAGMAVWYCVSGFGSRGGRQEGTLVWMEAPIQESAKAAFITQPEFVVVDSQL